MVATKTLNLLPDINSLRKLSQSLAMLDAILCPHNDLRTYSFNAHWGAGEMMAKLDNGGGDEYFILFDSAGAIIKGFDHESKMSPYGNDEGKIWSGVLDTVPLEFNSLLQEPAFSIEDITFCIWRRYIDSTWHVGNISYPQGDEDADGSNWMLSTLDRNLLTYQEWATDYHEAIVDLVAVQHIYDHQPLTSEIVKMLNVNLSIDELVQDIQEIGYPNK
jgi:hypothetical protein